MGAGTQVLTVVPWLLAAGEPTTLERALLMGAGWVINVVAAEWIMRGAAWRSIGRGAPSSATREQVGEELSDAAGGLLIVTEAAAVAEKRASCRTQTSETAKPSEAAKPMEAPKPSGDMVEHDMAVFGEAFKGYVVTAPKSAKLELDDPSRQIVLSDTNFVSISEAAYWEDGVAGLAQDKDNSNIKKVSDTKVRYERNPPIGKMWMVDTLVKIGDTKWSCGTGMTGPDSAEKADQIAAVCKSIKKK
jgi:hypothetical protein